MVNFGLEKCIHKIYLKLEFFHHSPTIYVEALCIPYICSPFRNPTIPLIQEKYEDLKTVPVDLASQDGHQTNVLVALDYYSSLVSGNPVRGQVMVLWQ